MAFYEVRPFDEIASGAKGTIERKTNIVTLASGKEEGNSIWANGRRHYDISTGILLDAEISEVIDVYEGCRGSLHGFRFKDYSDYMSCDLGGVPAFTDQAIGIGNGVKVAFQLIKNYGASFSTYARDITKPVVGTGLVGVNGVESTEVSTLGFGVNLVDNPDFITDTGVLTADTTNTTGLTATRGRNEIVGTYGTRNVVSARITGTPANSTYVSAYGYPYAAAPADVLANWIPVNEGEIYYVSVYGAYHNCTGVDLTVGHADSSGGSLGEISPVRGGMLNGGASGDLANFTRLEQFYVVPAGVAYIGMRFGVVMNGVGANPYGVFTAPMITQVDPAASVPYNYGAGDPALSGSFVLDYTTGIITFNGPPANAAEITAGYEFDVPVRFEDDKLDTTQITTYLAGNPQILLTEIK